MARKKPEGWRNKRVDDSWRHSQAAKGMKTVYMKRHPREIWLPTELFGVGGKGRWIDNSSGSIPVHHVQDLQRGIEIVEDSGRSVGALKLYGETPKFGLIGRVGQFAKAGGFDSSLSEDVAEKWNAAVILSYMPLTAHVGPNVGYHVHPGYYTPGSPYDTEMEARAAADRAAAKFLSGRTFEQAVKDDRARIVRREEKIWDERRRQYEFQKLVKGLPPVGK